MKDRDTVEVVRELLKIQGRLEHDRWENTEPIHGVFMRWNHRLTGDSLEKDSSSTLAVPYFDNPLYINGGNNPPPCTQLFTAISEHLHGRSVYELIAPAVEVLIQELTTGEIWNDRATTND